MPIEELLMKVSPLTSARSTMRMRPAAIVAAASSTGKGMPRSLAK